MKRHIHLPKQTWLLVLVIALLVVGHLAMPYFLSHKALSGAVVSGVILLVIAQHVGALGALVRALWTSFRRRSGVG